MNILYIGEMGDAVNNLIALSKIASKVVMVNTELTEYRHEVPGMRNAVGRSCRVFHLYADLAWGIRPKPKLKVLQRYGASLFGPSVHRLMHVGWDRPAQLRALIREEKIQLILASWGIGVIPDIVLVRSIDSDIPIIHYLPTFPTSYNSKLREWFELFLMGRNSRLINGFLTGSEGIKALLNRRYGAGDELILVSPICYSSEYFARDTLPRLSERNGAPHLVFTGTMDFSVKVNDVAQQLISLADAGIHVHCIEPSEKCIAHPFLHFFKRFDTPEMTDGSLGTFLTQFDGCIVLYNAAENLKRFESGIPQRFLSGFIGKLPIFLPRGILPSCESIIEAHDIGLAYKEVGQLAATLRDADRMCVLRKNAGEVSRSFSFEAQAGVLADFLQKFVSG